MDTLERIAVFRQRAADSEAKADSAQSENMRRAWLIVAREWKKMAEPQTAKPVTLDLSIKEPAKAEEAKSEAALTEGAKTDAPFVEAAESKLAPDQPAREAELVDAVEKALRDWRD